MLGIQLDWGQNQTEMPQQLLCIFTVILWNNPVLPELQRWFFCPKHTQFPLSHSLLQQMYFCPFSAFHNLYQCHMALSDRGKEEG